MPHGLLAFNLWAGAGGMHEFISYALNSFMAILAFNIENHISPKKHQQSWAYNMFIELTMRSLLLNSEFLRLVKRI